MDSYLLTFILFSFILIALILFMVFYTNELKKIKGQFKRKQYIIYLLGSLFILASLSLSYLLYLYGSIWLAISIFIAFNGIAIYFLYRASTVMKERE
jgi:amino acid transporter